MEQKIIFFAKDSIDYIGGQMKEVIEKACVGGWYVHQVVPTHYEEFKGGCLRIDASMIILHKKSPKTK